MVLADLGAKIGSALRKLQTTKTINDELINEIIMEIANALLKSDVNIKYVGKLRDTVKTQIKLQMNEMSGPNLKRFIQKTVVDELTNMLSSTRQPYEFKRNTSNVVMFVGLQGSGKTTTCTKFAYHYMRKGYKVGLVCADTFRAGAFEQLMMNAAKIKCPFFGHKKETDPVKIAQEGVEFFRKDKYEIIIVDTSGRHKQETALFEEMQQVQAVINPDTGVFVMDGSIGQACFAQAKAFKEAVKVGQVIVTKLDGHAKGGGSLSAVAATDSPIAFIGTGEHFEDFESFNAGSFIKRLLGLGDMEGLLKTMNDAVSSDQQRHIIEQIKKGQFTLRDMRDQFASVLNMGSIGNVVSMIPGFNANMIPKGQEKASTDRIKKFLCIMDSMTKEELDCIKPMNEKRVLRVARGAGMPPTEVVYLLGEHKKFSKMVEKMGKMNIDDNMDNLKRNPKAVMNQLQGALDPGMLKQMGGMGNIMNMVQEMSQNGGMQEMMQKMMGGNGGGGMPDMSQMASMMGQMGGGGGRAMPPGMKGMMRKGRR